MELQKSVQACSPTSLRTGDKMGPGRPPEAPKRPYGGLALSRGLLLKAPLLDFVVGFVFVFCVLLFLFHADDDVDDDVHDDDFDVNDVDDDVDNDVDDDVDHRHRPPEASKKAPKCHPLGRDPQNAPRWPHDDSDTLQDAPKTPPRRPKTTKQCEHH